MITGVFFSGFGGLPEVHDVKPLMRQNERKYV